jgi:hypothetical protein
MHAIDTAHTSQTALPTSKPQGCSAQGTSSVGTSRTTTSHSMGPERPFRKAFKGTPDTAPARLSLTTHGLCMGCVHKASAQTLCTGPPHRAPLLVLPGNAQLIPTVVRRASPRVPDGPNRRCGPSSDTDNERRPGHTGAALATDTHHAAPQEGAGRILHAN